MSLDKQQANFLALNNWFFSEQGNKVAQAFILEIQNLKDILKGDIILQLAECGSYQFYRSLSFRNPLLITPNISGNSQVTAAFNQLPFDKESIDCIIAPLILEGLSSEKSPINEMDRILKPMGHIVFFGINPLSFWGVWLKWNKNNCFKGNPVKLQYLLAVKSAMNHLGYIQSYLSTFYFAPPIQCTGLEGKLTILNHFGKIMAPWPAGFYCYVVQKYQEKLIGGVPAQEINFLPPNKALQPTCCSHFY